MHTLRSTAIVLIVLLALSGFGDAQVKETPRPDNVPAELTAKANEALTGLAREAGQLNSGNNRVRARIEIAQLMWRSDEREARLLFDAAYAELRMMLAAANLPEGVELTTIERSDLLGKRYEIADLRSELVLAIAPFDAKAALNMLAGLQVKLIEEYDPLNSDDLQLKITQAIAKDDPDRSYTVAKQQLDTNGVSYQFVETLRDLHKRDGKLGAKLGQDILSKFKSSRIRVPRENDGATAAKKDGEVEFWETVVFLNAASQLNRLAAGDKSKKLLPLLSETDMRELVTLVANAFLAEPAASPYSISQILPEIAKYSPALNQRIRRKIGDTMSAQLDKIADSTAYYDQLSEKSADELAQLADVSAADIRDSRYSYAVAKALETGDAEKALAISAKIKDRKAYAYLFDQINSELPLAKARSGDLAEVRKQLASLPTDRERIITLAELASTLAGKGEKEAAKTLLDESRQMMSAYLKRQSDLELIVKVAGAYAISSPEDAFLLVESAIGQLGEVINAGIKLSEYYDDGTIDADELLFSTMSRQLVTNVQKSPELLKNLAIADFDRTMRLSDGFQRPEIRIYARIRIAEAILDKDALEKEQKRLEQYSGEEDVE